MKKLLVLPVLVLAALTAVGVATADDAKGPACAEITDTTFFYSTDQTTATVTIFLAAASCPSLSYSIFVQDSLTESALRGSESVPGDGHASNSITVTAAVDEQDGNVCLFATTSAGRHVFDRAPNTGQTPECVELTPGGVGGGGGSYN